MFESLAALYAIMQEGIDLLGEVQEGLIPEEQRKKIFAQRKEELLAYAAYVRAQRRLWSLLADSDRDSSAYPTPFRSKETSREHSSRERGDSRGDG